jgi:hypothetical protein
VIAALSDGLRMPIDASSTGSIHFRATSYFGHTFVHPSL